jgi:hypothetical protein
MKYVTLTIFESPNQRYELFSVEYIGNVNYIKNKEFDDCDQMTLLLAIEAFNNLVICDDKHKNISRIISGINSHTLKVCFTYCI